ncbi:MAG: TPM domain-containing protein [bacterium]
MNHLFRQHVVTLLALLVVGATVMAAPVPVPVLKSRVTDLTGTLNAGQCQQLEGVLQQFESTKGSQVVVLIIPSTGEETIEQFGIRVADAWKIGRQGVNDGAILLVAKNDRTLRIEVGRGLERALEVFSKLHVWDTSENNGVLIYLLLADRHVEIVADRGVDKKVGSEGWEPICRHMEHCFAAGGFEKGILEGIQSVSEILVKEYPSLGVSTNELPDEPVILK